MVSVECTCDRVYQPDAKCDAVNKAKDLDLDIKTKLRSGASDIYSSSIFFDKAMLNKGVILELPSLVFVARQIATTPDQLIIPKTKPTYVGIIALHLS